jgi:hypothetical protein
MGRPESGAMSALRTSSVAHDVPPEMAIAYSALLFIAAHAWLPWYGFGDGGAVAYLSYVVQQLALILLYALADSRLKHRTHRFLLASAAALYLAYIHLDALLIDVVGLSSYRTLFLFTAGGWGTLAEIGLKPARLALLISAVLAMCAAGGIAHRLLDRWRIELRPGQRRIGWALALVLPALFVSEQVLSRDRERYIYRSIELPGYLQIFETATHSHDIALQSPDVTVARHAYLGSVGAPRNPRHVLFILLESVRADAIRPEISPTLALLSHDSLSFTNAYTEAIFTPLSWNVLLLDSPVHMFMWPRTMMTPREPGSWPLNVLRRAGYRIWISSSTDLDYGHFLPFMLGRRELVDRLNIIRAPELERWQRDDRATADLVEWIESSPFDAPTFMLLQLDSTHWTYQFPEERAVVKPFSKPLTMPVPLTTEEEFRLLHNRYLNCVHHVDRKIGQAIAALHRRGIEEETALVVVSDHGEGFSPGIQGHAVLCEATTRVPMMMRLPGVPAEEVAELVSFRNLFPTLFDYLQIDSFDQGLMLGRSVLPPRKGESQILMFAPDGRRADLLLADGRRLQFNVLMRESLAWFTPVGVVDHLGMPHPDARGLLESMPWREMVEERMRFNAGALGQTQPPTVSAAHEAIAPSG